MSLQEKKNKIIPKIKKMEDFAVQKLDLTSQEARDNIDTIKARLQDIDI